MEGEIYTEVDASVLNPGISTMAMISGNPEPPEGGGNIVVWYRWRYNEETGDGGFTGNGWYFADPHTPLKNYFGSEQEFKDYLVKNRPTDLNKYLGGWSNEDKLAFLTEHNNPLFDLGCIYYAT